MARVRIRVGESEVEHLGVLRPEGEWQSVPQGVEEYVVPEQVALHGQQECCAAALQTLEKVGPAEAHQPFAGAREVLDMLCFSVRRRRIRRIGDVVSQSIAGQVQCVDRSYDAW